MTAPVLLALALAAGVPSVRATTAHLPPSPMPVAPATGVYVGRAGQTRVPPPRIEADATIDGTLDEPVWQRAARLTGFSQFAPVDGIPAADSTVVLVWYSPTAIYFGVHAYEAHGAVQPRLADRDHIDAEDRIELLLGTFGDGRQAYVFQVNPLGVQADGTLVETAQSGSYGHASDLVGRQAPDLSADFVFQSRGRVTPDGYDVEIRIPFKSIRYQASRTQDWSFNVTRHVRHSGYDDTWAPARRAAASFLGQSGALVGLTDLRRGLVLDVNPEITQTATGAPRDDGHWGYEAGRTNVGGNVRWGMTSNLTLNATVRPDFSQVEADAGQLSYDPRQALFFAERRPFFLDGIEQFDVPNQLIYTRRIVQPTAAGKLTGTVAGTNVALLTAADDPTTSLDGHEHPLFDIVRVQRDLGPAARVGALVTDREDGRDYNRVGGLDTRILFGKIYSVQAQAAASTTDIGGRHVDGPLWDLRFNRNGRVFGMDYAINGIDPDFVTQSGFISQSGLVNAHLTHRLTYLAPRGSFVEGISGAVGLLADWQYRTFLRHGDVQDKKLHFDVNASLRGGWRAGVGMYTEVFGYDPALYANYRLALPIGTAGTGTLDTVAFVGRRRIPNHDYVLNLSTPQGAHFDANAFILFGQDENFYEWQQADILIMSLAANWRPTQQLRVNATYAQQQYQRSDGSLVALRRIPYVKMEYQVSRPVFVRLVTEYDAQHVAPLRDDGRTNAPVLLYDPNTGTYAPSTASHANNLRLQGLFAYQPVPGTVFFAGYGALLDQPEAFRWQGLARENDGFFVKLSYLIRAQ